MRRRLARNCMNTLKSIWTFNNIESMCEEKPHGNTEVRRRRPAQRPPAPPMQGEGSATSPPCCARKKSENISVNQDQEDCDLKSDKNQTDSDRISCAWSFSRIGKDGKERSGGGCHRGWPSLPWTNHFGCRRLISLESCLPAASFKVHVSAKIYVFQLRKCTGLQGFESAFSWQKYYFSHKSAFH